MLATYWHRLVDSADIWALVGLAGQILFAGRFLLQWLHAERVQRSEIPLGFWYLSIAGSLVVLVYAIRIADPVFIIGQAAGLFVYLRNLQLIYRERGGARVPEFSPAGFIVALWAATVAAALWARPLLPIDETRYLSVAWEMHLADHWLVPLLDGEPYSHKPPLLFWLIRIGWLVFGVNEVTARLVAPLFGLGALGLTALLARLLWPGPDGHAAGKLAPLLLLTAAWWLAFTTLTMFDLMLAFFAVLAWIGLALALRHGQPWRGFALAGLALGLGALTKGPVILVYVLPAALLAPFWAPTDPAPRPRWSHWYLGVLAAVALGAAIGLAWALAAAEAGGPAYRQALLWGQTAGRVRSSFAHGRPFWWYLPLLPLLFFPWLLWRPAWVALAAWRDAGVRFGLIVFGAGLLVFSAISGKQPHYLLPLFPALALVIGRGLASGRVLPRRRDSLLPAALVAALALAAALAPVVVSQIPRLAARPDLPDWARHSQIGLALALTSAATLAIWLGRKSSPRPAIAGLAALPVGVFFAFHLVALPQLGPELDFGPAAAVIRRGLDQGHPVAFAGGYQGEYQFLGRLTRPLPEIARDAVPDWLQQHPDGWVVERFRPNGAGGAPPALYAEVRSGRATAIWDQATVAARAGFFGRN